MTMRLRLALVGQAAAAGLPGLVPGDPLWVPRVGHDGRALRRRYRETIRAGETYLIPPGHLPLVEHEPAVMVEFSQDTTYTQLAKK